MNRRLHIGSRAALALWLCCSLAWPATWTRTRPCACASKGDPASGTVAAAGHGSLSGAKLLEAELEEKHDVYIYEVELLTVDGVVRELDLDAATGRLLKDEEDD